ncbi:MAG: WYL domain-containing protein [Pirellulaceae bacterium]
MPEMPPLLRQWTLLRTLSARRLGATLREMAEGAGVSQKTALRDLALLRKIGFPLTEAVGHRGLKHWKLNGQAGVPPLSFTLEEAAALYLGRQFLEPLAGTYFFHGALSAFQKIRATLGDAALRHLEKLAAAFYHKTHGLADYSAKGELIDQIVRAIEDRRLSVISYRSLRTTEPVTHLDLHPYSLVWHKHALYLIGWSAGHGAIRTFKVDRISAVETQQLQFARPADFDPQRYLAGSFGIFQGDGAPQPVRVRFTPAAARVLSEKTFHPTQRLTREPDGSLIAEWELSSLEEFSSWILSWGKEAEVLEPQSLREKIAGEMSECLGKYRLSKGKARSRPAGAARQKPR